MTAKIIPFNGATARQRRSHRMLANSTSPERMLDDPIAGFSSSEIMAFAAAMDWWEMERWASGGVRVNERAESVARQESNSPDPT